MIKVVTPSSKDMNPRYECTCHGCGCVFQCDDPDFECGEEYAASLAVKCPMPGCNCRVTKNKAVKLPAEPVSIEKKWKSISFFDAMMFAARRIPATPQIRVDGADIDEDVIVFTDGTALAVRSSWDGPLSEVTPEITATDPKWRVYR